MVALGSTRAASPPRDFWLFLALVRCLPQPPQQWRPWEMPTTAETRPARICWSCLKALVPHSRSEASSNCLQARGKKNLVIGQELAGPVGLFVKFSELQQYGVDRVFLLENANIDSSQRNVVFLVRGEKANHVRTVAGKAVPFYLVLAF